MSITWSYPYVLTTTHSSAVVLAVRVSFVVCLFCRRNFSISFPDTNEPVACKIGGLSPLNSLRCLEGVVTALLSIGGTVMSVELPQDCRACIDCLPGKPVILLPGKPVYPVLARGVGIPCLDLMVSD